MLRSVYLKTIRDRWLGAVIGISSLFLVAWMGLWAYAGMGVEAGRFIETFPPAYQSLIGITPDSGVSGMMLGQMFNFLGPFVVAGIAISMGAAAIAGEEADRTINLFASMPRSRTRILVSTTLAGFTVVSAITVLAWGSYVAAVVLSGTDVGSLNLGAATLHLTVVALLYGALALAIGASTGQQSLASGASVAFLVLSFLGAGLLPLFDGWDTVATIFPWYYISGATPLVNGVHWGHIALVLCITVTLVAIAWWGLRRRDLRDGATHTPLLKRLSQDERLTAVLARLQGSASVHGPIPKALSESRAVLTVAGGGLFAMLVIMGPMFNALGPSLGDIVDAMPDQLLSMVGFADYSSAEGWYHGEALSILSPVAIAVVTIGAGMALAGEEKRRTINVLLGTPTSRTEVAWSKAAVVALLALVVGVLAAGGIALGNMISGLGMDYGNIVAAGALLTGLGVVLGAVAFLGGAVSASPAVAMGAGTGVAILGWGVNAFVAVNEDLEPWARLSPFYYYANNFPLTNGLIWWHLAVLLGASAVLMMAGVVAYGRRDLKG